MTFSPIDLYCERTAIGIWNEPINAASNLAFIIAAILAWHTLSKRGNADWQEKTVILLGGFVGVGSFLFHTFANSLTEMADIIPIWSFVASYTLLCIYRSTGENRARTLRIALISLLVVSGILYCLPEQSNNTAEAPLNGSLQYTPALVTLIVFSLLGFLRKNPAWKGLSIATVMFFIALVFRSIDLHTCNQTNGIGTHFVWHLTNGAMVGVLLMTLIKKMPPVKARNSSA